jgi:hypothetical protein
MALLSQILVGQMLISANVVGAYVVWENDVEQVLLLQTLLNPILVG